MGLTISLFNIIKTKALECVSIVNTKNAWQDLKYLT